MEQSTATAAVAVRGDTGTDGDGELAVLCTTLLENAEVDRRRIAGLESRLDQLVRLVRFSWGTFLEGLEEPASERVLDLAGA